MILHLPPSRSLLQVRRESKDHATLSDLYLNNVISRLTHISEDSARLLKRVSSDIFFFFCSTNNHPLVNNPQQMQPFLPFSEQKRHICELLLKIYVFSSEWRATPENTNGSLVVNSINQNISRPPASLLIYVTVRTRRFETATTYSFDY